jgi:sterol desaturase/sphingolipid hydroxylase (fatty acid hydroxylase superfamily)
MKTRQVRRSLNHARIAAMSLLLISFYGAVLFLTRVLPENIFGTATAFVAGLIVTPIIASPLEWLVHRYIYHRSFGFLKRIYTVHAAHHHLYFPTWRYVTAGPARRIPILGKGVNAPQIQKWKNAVTFFAHFVFYMTIGAVFIWLPAWLISQNAPFLAGAIAGTLIISNLFITVHDAIHRPGSHRFMESQAWFRFLDEHHYIHHVDTEANVNFLLPLADWLFGTLRKTLTDEEIARHGTRETAKARVVGAGEPAIETGIYEQKIMPAAVETA